MSGLVAGIDLGGTKTRIGTVLRDRRDQVIWSQTVPTRKDDPAATMREIAAALPKEDLIGAGIGVPGPLDLEARRLGALPNLPRWEGYPVCDVLEAMLGVPVAIDNDANVAALGELRYGAGRGYQDFIFITLGTGIGGAIVSGGRVLSGARGGAGEIGHIQVDPDGPLCGCGRRGCVESLASGPAIEKAYGKPTEEVFKAAAEGDARAVQVLVQAGQALGFGLSEAVTLLDPEAVIFGGGMARGLEASLSIYLEACRSAMEKRAYLPWKGRIPFLRASLGEDGPIIGASLLVEEQPRLVPKPWGEELWWAIAPPYVGKRITVRAGHSLSLQYHRRKLETMFFVSGTGILIMGDRKIGIGPGLSVTIRPNVRHRVIASEDVTFFEVSTPEVDDVVRLEDNYGRAP